MAWTKKINNRRGPAWCLRGRGTERNAGNLDDALEKTLGQTASSKSETTQTMDCNATCWFQTPQFVASWWRFRHLIVLMSYQLSLVQDRHDNMRLCGNPASSGHQRNCSFIFLAQTNYSKFCLLCILKSEIIDWKLFHSLGAPTSKARSPLVLRSEGWLEGFDWWAGC